MYGFGGTMEKGIDKDVRQRHKVEHRFNKAIKKRVMKHRQNRKVNYLMS